MTGRPVWIASMEEAARVIDRGERMPFRVLFEHGSLQAGVYLPGTADHQRPHNRDEVYIVMAGSGTVYSDGERTTFGPGDMIFVAAHVEHRFEEYTPDLALWVLFYGPEGGEQRHNSEESSRAAAN